MTTNVSAVPSTTTTISDDFLNLFPRSDPAQDGFVAGVDDGVPDERLPTSGYGRGVVSSGVVLMAVGAVLTASGRRRRPHPRVVVVRPWHGS